MRRVKVRGAKRMKDRGCKRVEMWLDARELSSVSAAAAADGMKLATWIREAAVHKAEEAHRERIREQQQLSRGG
jgi:hypothetical protein